MGLTRTELMQERRKERRYLADLEGRLVWDSVSQPVRIRNISIYGAMLVGAFLPPVGTRIVLITDGLEVCGSIIWLRGEQCGLLLEQGVEPLTVLRDRPVRTAEPPRPSLVTLKRVGPGCYA